MSHGGGESGKPAVRAGSPRVDLRLPAETLRSQASSGFGFLLGEQEGSTDLQGPFKWFCDLQTNFS